METENYTFRIEGPKLKADIEIDRDTIDIVNTIVTLLKDKINFERLQSEPEKEPFDPFELKTTEDGTFIFKCRKCGFESTDGKLFERMDKCLKCAEKTEGNKVYSSSTEKKAELEDKDKSLFKKDDLCKLCHETSISGKLKKGLEDLKEDNYTQVRPAKKESDAPKKGGRKKGPFEETIAGKITILFQKMKTLQLADITKAHPEIKYATAAKTLSAFKAEGKVEKMPERYWMWKGEIEKPENGFTEYHQTKKTDKLSEDILTYIQSKPRELIDTFVLYRDLEINQEDEQKVWGKVIKLSRENDEVFTYKGSFNKRYVSFEEVKDLPRIVKLMSKPVQGLGSLF